MRPYIPRPAPPPPHVDRSARPIEPGDVLGAVIASSRLCQRYPVEIVKSGQRVLRFQRAATLNLSFSQEYPPANLLDFEIDNVEMKRLAMRISAGAIAGGYTDLIVPALASALDRMETETEVPSGQDIRRVLIGDQLRSHDTASSISRLEKIVEIDVGLLIY